MYHINKLADQSDQLSQTGSKFSKAGRQEKILPNKTLSHAI